MFVPLLIQQRGNGAAPTKGFDADRGQKVPDENWFACTLSDFARGSDIAK
jgi:hypothetical protein